MNIQKLRELRLYLFGVFAGFVVIYLGSIAGFI